MVRSLGLLLTAALLTGCGLTSAQWQQGDAADDGARDWATSTDVGSTEPDRHALTEGHLRKRLVEAGFPREGANCFIDETVRQVDLSRYTRRDFDVDTPARLAAALEQAGFACAEVIGGETLSEIFGPDVLSRPGVRDSFIDGLMQGDPTIDRRLAACVVDRLIDAGADVFLFIDAEPGDPAFRPVFDAFEACQTAAG